MNGEHRMRDGRVLDHRAVLTVIEHAYVRQHTFERPRGGGARSVVFGALCVPQDDALPAWWPNTVPG